MVAGVWSRRLRAAVAGAGVLCGAVLGACSTPQAAGGIPASAYAAALAAFLPEPPTDGDDDELPVVYVAPLGDSPLALDAQVAVIDDLAERCDLRFVDTVDVVIDDDIEGAPPRDEGVLLAIGTIHGEPPHTVRVEQYTDAERTAAHLITLVERSGEWSVVSVDDVDPEVLVGDG